MQSIGVSLGEIGFSTSSSGQKALCSDQLADFWESPKQICTFLKLAYRLRIKSG
jgi:hypothetical protein